MMPAKKRVILVEVNQIDSPIKVELVGVGRNQQYEVTYGLQTTIHHDWKSAAENLGYCIFHALECVGKIERPN
jgi:hypothetical protein